MKLYLQRNKHDYSHFRAIVHAVLVGRLLRPGAVDESCWSYFGVSGYFIGLASVDRERKRSVIVSQPWKLLQVQISLSWSEAQTKNTCTL